MRYAISIIERDITAGVNSNACLSECRVRMLWNILIKQLWGKQKSWPIVWCKNEIMEVNEVRYTVAGIFALEVRLAAVQKANFEPGISCRTLKRGFMNGLVVWLCLSLSYGCANRYVSPMVLGVSWQSLSSVEYSVSLPSDLTYLLWWNRGQPLLSHKAVEGPENQTIVSILDLRRSLHIT